MASSLSSFLFNLSEGINRIECKYGHVDKKCKQVKLNIMTVFLNAQFLKMI